MLTVDPHPLLEAAAFFTTFPKPLGEMPVNEELRALLKPGAEAPFRSDDAVRAAVRDLLPRGVKQIPGARRRDADAEGRLGPIPIDDADGQTAVERDHVASVDRRVDGSQRSIRDGPDQILRSRLSAPRGLVSAVAQEVADGRAHVVVRAKRGLGADLQERPKLLVRRPSPEGTGKGREEGSGIKQRMRIDREHSRSKMKRMRSPGM